MKSIQNIKILSLMAAVVLSAFSCTDLGEDIPNYPAPIDFSGTYSQEDQMGRPAVNTVFTSGENKKKLNKIRV